MTRFARVKGLNSGRKTEEATSWQDMRNTVETNQTSKKKNIVENRPNWKQKIATDIAQEININSEWTDFNNDDKGKSKKQKPKHKKFEYVSVDNTDLTCVTEKVGKPKNKVIKAKKENKNLSSIADEVEHLYKKDKCYNVRQNEAKIKLKTRTEIHAREQNDRHKNNKQTLSKQNKHNEVKPDIFKKNFDYSPCKRRKPDSGNYTELINGKNIDIVRYEGFFIKKEDAISLRKLKKKLSKKGIPHNELQAIMKLERRKAEKSLAREKKKVCFHCRKSGHNLSECSELKSNSSAVFGICFKCGSTEHTYFECKVSKEEDFRFAQCFICKEEGHIAKQCPDNPRGLYPKGGACRVCGDVTHMKKDCPELQEKSEQTDVTAETFSGQPLDVLDEELNTGNKQIKHNKKIKFF